MLKFLKVLWFLAPIIIVAGCVFLVMFLLIQGRRERRPMFGASEYVQVARLTQPDANFCRQVNWAPATGSGEAS